MTDDPLPYGSENVNKAIRPLKKVVPFDRKRHRVWSYSDFWKRTDIGADTKGLMATLLGHVDGSGCCWPTKPQLRRMCGWGRKKLDEKLDEARDLYLISWTHFTDEYGHKRNRYTLLFLRIPTSVKETQAHVSPGDLKVLPYT